MATLKAMPCTRPILAYSSPGETIQSVTTKTQYPNDLSYNLTRWTCGKCPDCKAAKARDWGIRIGHHAEHLEEQGIPSSYVTLTYNEKSLPHGATLLPSDIVKTFKTLRNDGKSFKYFQCGEYGEEFLRPHHHVIFLGEAFTSDRKLARTRHGRPIWSSDQLSRAWPHGNHEIETVNFAAGCYVAGYTTKKLHSQPIERTDPATGETWDVLPSYITMSKGIGTDWFNKYSDDIYPHDFVQLNDEKTARPPTWYDHLHSLRDPESWKAIQDSRKSFADQHSRSWQDLRNCEYVTQKKQDAKTREPVDT